MITTGTLKVFECIGKNMIRTTGFIIFSYLLTNFLAYANNTHQVTLYHAEPAVSNQLLSLTGSVEGRQNAQLAPLQSGVVKALLVEAGDRVTQGQKLMVLDAKLAQLTVKQRQAEVVAAQAATIEAKRLYQEVVTLSEKQLVAETLLAERQSAVEVTQAELQQAQSQLALQQEIVARHSLYATFDGVIAQRHIDLGEWVSPQSIVYSLVEQTNLRVKLAIPQQYYHQLSGQTHIDATVYPDFANSQAIQAKLTRLVPVADNTSRTITGYVSLPEENQLVAGMSAKVSLVLPKSAQTIVWLPKSAIKQHPDGGHSVFTVQNNRAKRQLVTIDKRQGEQVAVVGVSTDMPFVVSGVELLKDGDPVSVTDNKGKGQ